MVENEEIYNIKKLRRQFRKKTDLASVYVYSDSSKENRCILLCYPVEEAVPLPLNRCEKMGTIQGTCFILNKRHHPHFTH